MRELQKAEALARMKMLGIFRRPSSSSTGG